MYGHSECCLQQMRNINPCQVLQIKKNLHIHEMTLDYVLTACNPWTEPKSTVMCICISPGSIRMNKQPLNRRNSKLRILKLSEGP